MAVYTDDNAAVNIVADNSALNGNVINKGITNISLASNASWTGTMQNVTGMSLASGSALNLTGTSTIGTLTNGGTVSVANGKNVGNTLTVGNYAGNNGTLVFNSTLGGNGSATDKMVVTGNTSGTTNVSVNNIGGTGAATLDGIELISVGGKSDGTFTQKGRIVAGAYDYHLLRGQGNNGKNWYLDSQKVDPGPGPGPDPKPTPVDHVVRPEAGSYIANQAASSMFLTSLHDRAGENRYMNVLDNEGNVTSLWLRQVGNHNRFRD
ncbi:autotransporter outer membrane beta-barrel domain-containing protein, partial [Enterobacter bugandensis]|uniref:autotransporter outer membrane beta-barrel domain-containing protein n=1 Tax=Enterobacter bugandensis TaxID=881260 RepID=UPI001EFA21D1